MCATTTSPPELDVRTLIQQLNDRWDHADGEGYAALFTPDATYVQFNGTLLRGRQEIADMHSLMFRTLLYGTRLVTHEIESVHVLRDDVAVVVATGAALYPWQPEIVPKRLSRQTLTLVKKDGHWLVEAFHNGRIKPLATSGPLFSVGAKAIRMRVDRVRRAA
ncbi:SgcJ/EcaC family oxidoreductase [Streptomyces sp. NPDC050147]|uniref:SgcJ/EcaC family oxidoreductase n=1 Tax=Streptomyces sp. NPDC050147 TaxID=3155513 RepID=UPI0034198756